MIGLVWSLLASLILMSCGGTQVAQTQNPQSPQWTVENPDAAAGRNLGSSAEAKRLTSAPSSLEALQSGQSTATPASSPVKDVYFGFDRYDLTDEGRATLKANADWLKSNPAMRMQIEGHCDERGTADYRRSVMEQRSRCVANIRKIAGRKIAAPVSSSPPVNPRHDKAVILISRESRVDS